MTGLIPLPCALDFADFILTLGKNAELQDSVHTHAFPAAIAERTAPQPCLFEFQRVLVSYLKLLEQLGASLLKFENEVFSEAVAKAHELKEKLAVEVDQTQVETDWDRVR